MDSLLPALPFLQQLKLYFSFVSTSIVYFVADELLVGVCSCLYGYYLLRIIRFFLVIFAVCLSFGLASFNRKCENALLDVIQPIITLLISKRHHFNIKIIIISSFGTQNVNFSIQNTRGRTYNLLNAFGK